MASNTGLSAAATRYSIVTIVILVINAFIVVLHGLIIVKPSCSMSPIVYVLQVTLLGRPSQARMDRFHYFLLIHAILKVHS
jgi:hypothetical protein